MKYLFLVFTLTLVLTNKTLAQMDRHTDSLYLHHLIILAKAAKEKKKDSVIYCCPGSIAFMEITSGIEAKADGTPFGRLYFTKSELEKWRQWYFQNTYIKSPKN
jgi:hypothetical protein